LIDIIEDHLAERHDGLNRVEGAATRQRRAYMARRESHDIYRKGRLGIRFLARIAGRLPTEAKALDEAVSVIRQ